MSAPSSDLLTRLDALVANWDTTLRARDVIAPPDAIQNAYINVPNELPERGLGSVGALELVERVVLPGLAGGQSGPRYFGFVTGGVLPSALQGDFLTSMHDSNVQVHLPRETIATFIESRTLNLILDLTHLPRDIFTLRTLTTGATASNVLGLASGRDYAVKYALGDDEYSVAEDGYGGAVVKILSDRPHASLVKAASLVGIGRSNVIDLYDPKIKAINVEKLEEYLAKAERGGKVAYIVSPSFGEVNTGETTVNMTKIRELCDKYHAWIHIDAAFGGFARIVPELAHHAAGLELANSITLDGHKWLNVPYDAGLFFSRSPSLAQSIFGPSPHAPPPAYLTPSAATSSAFALPEDVANIPSPLNVGIENSRRFRALPMFCALMDLGREGYVDLIRRNVRFARKVGKWMSEGEGKTWYEVLNVDVDTGEVPLNIVLFRGREGGGEKSAELVSVINATRKMYVSPSKGAVRLAVSNWMTGLRGGVDGNEESEEDWEIVAGVLKGVMKGQ